MIVDFPRPFGGALRVTHKRYRKTFHPRCGFAAEQITLLQRFHPLWGFLKTYKYTLSFRRKPFSPRLISNGGKMERMPMPCAMGLALECILKIISSKRRILKEDIPDIKAFFSCVVDGAKSHLKWAEAVCLLFREKVTEVLGPSCG